MAKKSKARSGTKPRQVPGASSTALRGKQSVRVTFRLSPSCISAINIVATHLRIKQKALFDHLTEDPDLLRTAATEGNTGTYQPEETASKTIMISRNALAVMDAVSKELDVVKEALIEISVRRLLPIIAREKINHEARKQIMDRIGGHLEAGKKIQQKIQQTFGPDDIVHKKFDQVMTHYRNCAAEIEKYIEKGKNIEAFDPDTIDGHLGGRPTR